MKKEEMKATTVADNKGTTKTTKKVTGTKPVATPKKAEEKPDNMNPPAVEMSTDVFSKEMLTELKKREKVIRDGIGKIDSSFEKIAFNLYWINAKEAYKAEGYDNIAKYSDETFGYQKSTCYSLMAVVQRFAKRDESGNLLEQLDERYKGYSCSKLSLMVGLTDAQIDSLKPEMSVRDIKAFVKSLNGKALPELSEGDGEDAETDSAEEPGVIDGVAKEVVTNTIIKCKGKADYDSKIDQIDDLINRVLKAHPDAVIEVSYTTV